MLAATTAITAGLGWGVSTLARSSGASPIDVPWTTLVVGVVLGAVVLWAGWTVRLVRVGRRRMDPTRAVRTAVLGQACAYAGALLAGFYAGYAAALLPDWSHTPRREAALAAALAALGGLVMLVAGVVAERWCRIGPDDEDDEGSDSAEAGMAH